ncbi:MAG: hypothetical protein M3N48_04860 [Verrucomicrobiota bacterium]|nr:hypothetical protein [Verrucomicrobiota bacterium]
MNAAGDIFAGPADDADQPERSRELSPGSVIREVATIPLMLMAVPMLPNYIPAVRAMKVDPMVALRYT